MKVYTTVAGDRWDAIAYRFYGDPAVYDRVIYANPTLPVDIKIAPQLPAGLSLQIPIIETPPVTMAGAPPWKAGA